METYLDAMDMWEAVEEDYEVPSFPNNPTISQIKNHKDRKTRKSKAKACLFSAISSSIFTRIMSLKSAKAIWDYLKVEYEGDEMIRGMQVLNLIRDFEIQKMKETETIKDYSERLLNIANRVRLLGSVLNDSRIVEKILVTVPERFEATINTLENTKDLSKITFAELLNALQAHEQRRVMREEGNTEGALFAKPQDGGKNKKKKNKKNGEGISASTTKGKSGHSKKSYPLCKHNKKGHPSYKCWRRPDARCSKCNQLGHEVVICKNNGQQQEAEAQIVDGKEEDQLFVATCFSSRSSSKYWLIDSGCTNHMTNGMSLFKELKPTTITKVRLGNGDHLPVRGKGTIAIPSHSGTKTISDVLYVPDIDQNLLNVGQLMEKGYKLNFKDNHCLIKDASDQEMFKVRMRGKSLSLDPFEEEHVVFSAKESVAEVWHKRLYIDIAAPQRTPSLKGSLYYIIFIDDLTRMCWIYFLKHKSKVANVFGSSKQK
uniref:Retrovirus-related Pol polyprotein from transposon TNT 1-94-like beta-barrel domain-containing protein n=1 Tax=Solanum tuberosum TaxID=4113 RepID=M1B1W5_SOLTU